MRNFRILRNPDGGDSAGTVTAEAGSQSQEAEGESLSAEGSQSSKPSNTQPAAPAVDKPKALAVVLEKTKKKGYTPSDAELDLLEEHWEGKLQPEKGEAPDPDDETSEEGEQPKDATKPKPKPAGADALNSELQKELGAKSVEEILPKLRELKKFTGSRDAQAYKTLEQKHQTLERETTAERNLWEDVKKGEPQAIEYLERQITQARQRHNIPASRPAQGQQGQGSGATPLIDRSKFTFPDEADAINSALDSKFGEFRGIIEQQAATIRELKGKDDKREQDHLLTTAQTGQLDETMVVADFIPELKAIPGLRAKVTEWIQNPDANIPELKILDELYDIANQNKTNIRIAWDVLEARRLREQIKSAKDAGVREVYGHKPNQSLSDMQGKGGIPYKTHSDAELRAMESNHALIPDEWFDRHGNLDEKKIPERARKLLMATEDRA